MDHDFSWRGTYTSRVPPRVAVARTAITRVAITRVVITHVAGYYTRGWLLHAALIFTGQGVLGCTPVYKQRENKGDIRTKG